MIHWLKIEDNKEAWSKWNNLKQYMDSHVCTAEIFINTYSLDGYIIRLKCSQKYNDLELKVDSLDEDSIQRLERKPANIKKINKSIDMYFNRYVK